MAEPAATDTRAVVAAAADMSIAEVCTAVVSAVDGSGVRVANSPKMRMRKAEASNPSKVWRCGADVPTAEVPTAVVITAASSGGEWSSRE